ncbi:MAG: sensor histidine kinase [Candidatus Kryptoniota bacterium]
MSEMFLLAAAIFSLLLTIAYGFVRKQSRIALEFHSAQNIKSLAGLVMSKSCTMEDVLKKILTTLTKSYNSNNGKIEIHGKLCGDLSFSIGETQEKGIRKPETGKDDNEVRRVTFAVYDEDFTCRVELYTAQILSHDEYWHIQELIREKISLSVFARIGHDVPGRTVSPGRGYEETDSLLFTAMDDMNFGVVALLRDADGEGGELKIQSINKAFYRIFGLDGSNAQMEEVNEILSTAIGPDDTKNISAGASHAGNDFFFMRRDGLKVRAKLILLESQAGVRIIIFEPLENMLVLMASYRRLFNAAEHLIRTGNIRDYLKEIREATRSDGVALAKRIPGERSFDIIEKAGFIINVPQLLFEDLSSHDFINSQGYLIVPMREEHAVSGAMVVLKPFEEAIEIAFAAAKILEASNMIQKEIHDLHFESAKLETEAKRAIAANNSKSEFLANMSHELRTPLNSIIGFADILNTEASELAPTLLSDFSGNIVAAGKHLLSLINDILDLTKVEMGKMKLDLQDFSLSKEVESVERTLKPLLDSKKVKFDVHIVDTLEVIVADPVKFKQILYNLLSNAISHSPAGSTVALEIVKAVDGIEMKVIDKGLGIKKEDLDKLFKPFSQLNASDGGTGLGLALTKKLVELHGGSIWIDSNYGIGTNVVIYLPDCPINSAADAGGHHDIKVSAANILFVTDDDELYRLFTAIVEGMALNIVRVSPKKMCEMVFRKEEEFILVVDAMSGNVDENIMPACGAAARIVLLTEKDDLKAVCGLLKDYEDKVSSIDRRNFTKSELVAELNTITRL